MITTRLFAVGMLIQAAILSFPANGKAQTMPSPALTGIVSSQKEGPMEGVLVSAKRTASTITVTVVSDKKGRYSFPRNRLEPGQYGLQIRAVGYDLQGPGAVEVVAQKTTSHDLKLRETQDLAAQLTNAEWFESWPGTTQQKMVFADCISCHSAERIARSHFTASDFEQVVQRMSGYASVSGPSHPVRRLHMTRAPASMNQKDLEYLSSINLSNVSKWAYPLRTLPRPKGKATRVIITEYDLPRPYSSPHDVVVSPDGMVWFGEYGEQYIGMLNPKTAKVVEYPVPMSKPGFDTGITNVEVDSEGNVWLALFYQTGLAKFNPHTEKFQVWTISKDLDSGNRRTTFIAPLNYKVDGKVWAGGGMDSNFRLDLQSGQWEALNERGDLPQDSPIAARPHGIYGLASDSKNNLYELDIKSEFIVKVDANSLKATYFQTPTIDSGPRRGHMDSNDRLWFGEHEANQIGMFDTKTNYFQEWPVPTPFSNPYDAVLDKQDHVWVGGMTSDRIIRLDPKTGEIIEYLLPRSTNVRHVNVDNSTTPVTFWVGNTHAASIIKVEPLE